VKEPPDYTMLDAGIITAVEKAQSRPLHFVSIMVYTPVNEEARRLAEGTPRKWHRIIDLRLQVLRKKGLLKYSRKGGWEKGEAL
jgi:hypothetical protein